MIKKPLVFTEKRFEGEKRLCERLAIEMIPELNRAEAEENLRVYLKAIRATLIAIGFDEVFVEVRFRTLLEEYFKTYYGIEQLR